MPRPEDVTLAICTRERPEMLASALASFTAVTPPGVQILVVDSASTTPATWEVADAAGVDYVRSDIKGLSIARNLALESSRRPIVVFTDDDCAAVEGWMAPILEGFDDPAVGAVTGRMLDHTLVGTQQAPPPRRFTRTIEGIDAGHGAIMAFRRERTVALGGFDPVLGAGRRLAGAEDLDMFCRVLDAGHAIVHDPACVIHHMNTRVGDDYTALHLGYGLGLGAMANKTARLRLGTGLALLAVLVKRTIGRAVRHRRDPRKGRADRAMLRGIADGFLAGARMRLHGTTFIDEHPPAPTPIGDPAGRDTGRTR